ncbi:unnamed protein product, partial [marine sediment metagenome]
LDLFEYANDEDCQNAYVSSGLWTVDGLEYTTRIKLTIDRSKISATLTDFPLLVKLTTNELDFTKSNPDGFDIRFTQSDGETLLKYERERHDSGNSLAEYWVKLPDPGETGDASDTYFYMYYRTTDTDDGADETAVWDEHFKAVYHLDDPNTGTHVDDSTTLNDGTKKGSSNPSQADAKIGKGQDFSSDEITCGTNLMYQYLTFEAWVNPDSLSLPNHKSLMVLLNICHKLYPLFLFLEYLPYHLPHLQQRPNIIPD